MSDAKKWTQLVVPDIYSSLPEPGTIDMDDLCARVLRMEETLHQLSCRVEQCCKEMERNAHYIHQQRQERIQEIPLAFTMLMVGIYLIWKGVYIVYSGK